MSNADDIVMAALDPSGDGFCWVTSNGRLNAWWPEQSDRGSDDRLSQLFVKAHENGATALAVSPSGSWLATGGGDGATRIWKINTMEAQARAVLKKMPLIKTVASGHSGKIIAAGYDSSGTRILHDDIVQPFPDLALGENLGWLYLSTDGNSLVASSGQTMHIFDAKTLQKRTSIEGVSLFHWGFNGPILAAAKSDGDLDVTLWDASTGLPLGRIPAAVGALGDIMFGSTERDQIAIATDTNCLSIWDIHDPAQPFKVQSMDTGDYEIKFVAFSAAENTIAAATGKTPAATTEDPTASATPYKVMVFDAKTAARLREISVPQFPSVMVFNAPGTLLALGFEDGSVSVWDCKNPREPIVINGSEAFANALALTSDNKLVTGGTDGRVRVWDLDGKLERSLPRPSWHPKDWKEAARLSGLKLENLEVRFLTPKEEEKLHIDESIPLDEDGLGEYWRAVSTTTRDFKTLEKTPGQPQAIEKADQLARWLSKHKPSSDVGTRERVQIAARVRDSLLDDLGRNLRSQAELSYKSKNYGVALAAVKEAIELETARTDASDAAEKILSSPMTSLLFLRGRILAAQNSPEASKDFQQIVDGTTPDFGDTSTETKALAHLYLAKLDPANLGAAERYCADLAKNPQHRSLFHYFFASVFAIRSASRGADNNARAKDITTAIESLEKGVALRNSSLREYVDSTPFLTDFEPDKLKRLLSEDERAYPKSEPAVAK